MIDHDHDAMFESPQGAPAPEETAFSDVTHASGTTTWPALLKSCRRVIDRLEAVGELDNSDVRELAESPPSVSEPGQYTHFLEHRVYPTLATHESVVWNDCWRYDPENEVSGSEWNEIASGFDIEASFPIGNLASEDPRKYYPRVISGLYRFLRETYEAENPRHGVSDGELIAAAPVRMSDEDCRACAGYLSEFPDISTPERAGNVPDWEWEASRSTEQAGSEVGESHG